MLLSTWLKVFKHFNKFKLISKFKDCEDIENFKDFKTFSIWILKETKLNLNNKDIKIKLLFQVEKDSCFEVVFMYSDIKCHLITQRNETLSLV